jgi:hypothetical protein
MSTAAACQHDCQRHCQHCSCMSARLSALRSSSLQLLHSGCQLQGAVNDHCDAVRVGTADVARQGYEIITDSMQARRKTSEYTFSYTPTPTPTTKMRDKCRKPDCNNSANSTSGECLWELAGLWSRTVQWTVTADGELPSPCASHI